MYVLTQLFILIQTMCFAPNDWYIIWCKIMIIKWNILDFIFINLTIFIFFIYIHRIHPCILYMFYAISLGQPPKKSLFKILIYILIIYKKFNLFGKTSQLFKSKTILLETWSWSRILDKTCCNAITKCGGVESLIPAQHHRRIGFFFPSLNRHRSRVIARAI